MNNRTMQKAKKNKVGNRRAGSRINKTDPALNLKVEYPGQPVLSTIIDSVPSTLSTTVTTGVISFVDQLGSGLIANFGTRFVSWNECRVVKVVAEVMNFSSTNPGVISMWFEDSANTGSPNLTQAEQAKALRFSASDQSKTHRLTYVPHDTLEQQWAQVSAGSQTIGNFKLYTDASYGSNVVATPYLTVLFKVTVQFRGFV